MAENVQGHLSTDKAPRLQDFLEERDYIGAAAFLRFQQKDGSTEAQAQEWLAYAHYHNWEHAQALELYRQLLAGEDADPLLHTYAAACLYYMGLYDQAEAAANEGPQCPLQNRILFHCAHKSGQEERLMECHAQLTDSVEDQLSLASIHYLRGHYQEAADVYKQLLLEHRDFSALNVYLGLCYSKLDYFDVSSEILEGYLQHNPDSAAAINLKACNLFKLYTGKAAEAEIKTYLSVILASPVQQMSGGSAHWLLRMMLQHASPVKALEQRGVSPEGSDLIRHNLVVFREGEGALQVLPDLLDVCPEARLNLAVYYLKQGQLQEAFKLAKDLQPATPQEYTLKGVVHAAMGQSQFQNSEHLRLAQQCFQAVGSSPAECDTIPGRQCMASCFFLLRQFEDVLIYLKSIKQYLATDDDFNWNYGIACASNGEWAEAEEAFGAVQGVRYRQEGAFLNWSARTFIKQGKPMLAWEVYLQQETSDKSVELLHLVANECYQAGFFLAAARAFDVLEQLDPSPEYWQAKQGACAGTLQMVVAGKESADALRQVMGILQTSSHPNAVRVMQVITGWASSKNIII